MVRIFEIDLDREKVFVQDEWLAADELAARVKDKLDRKDFSHLSLLSEALERLQEVIRESRLLEVRVTKEVADSYETIAKRSGQPIQYVLRQALNNYLTGDEANKYLIDPEAEAKLASLQAVQQTVQPAGEGLTSLAELESSSSQEGEDDAKE